MPRVIKEYAARRGEIIDAAQRLMETKGYEQMTIQDILNELQIAKGTFYHYFTSKPELLEAVIERMMEDMMQILPAVVQDQSLPALQKYQAFFAVAARRKMAHKELALALWNAWYSDDNALVRLKLRASIIRQLSPLFASILQQGVQEGVFHLSAALPAERAARYTVTAEVQLALLYDLGDAISELMLTGKFDLAHLDDLKFIIDGYTEAMERTVGASPGTVKIFDVEALKVWMME